MLFPVWGRALPYTSYTPDPKQLHVGPAQPLCFMLQNYKHLCLSIAIWSDSIYNTNRQAYEAVDMVLLAPEEILLLQLLLQRSRCRLTTVYGVHRHRLPRGNQNDTRSKSNTVRKKQEQPLPLKDKTKSKQINKQTKNNQQHSPLHNPNLSRLTPNLGFGSELAFSPLRKDSYKDIWHLCARQHSTIIEGLLEKLPSPKRSGQSQWSALDVASCRDAVLVIYSLEISYFLGLVQ